MDEEKKTDLYKTAQRLTDLDRKLEKRRSKVSDLAKLSDEYARLSEEYGTECDKLCLNAICPCIDLLKDSLDLEETGKKLYELRQDPALRKQICRHSRLDKESGIFKYHKTRGKYKKNRRDPCPRNYDCASCEEFYDKVSTSSFSAFINDELTVNQINDMSTYDSYDTVTHTSSVKPGKNITLEKIIFMAAATGRSILDIIVLPKGYRFTETGKIIKE